MATSTATKPTRLVSIHAPIPSECAFLLSPEALAFVTTLAETFGPRREALLAKRVARQKEFDAGVLPDFKPETKHIREGEWKVAEVPADLLDRRVEITGPAEPKMIINALNSGAKVFMADLEDSLAPTWARVIEGQKALYDAVPNSCATARAFMARHSPAFAPALPIITCCIRVANAKRSICSMNMCSS